MTDLRKAHPYGWTRQPTYEELDKIFLRCRELHLEAEGKLKAIEKVVDEYFSVNDFGTTYMEHIKLILEGKVRPLESTARDE